MKVWNIEEGTPCIIVKDLTSNADPISFMTTKELTFDYPFWDIRQVHNRGINYLTNRAEESGHNMRIIRKIADGVTRNGMIAFTQVNGSGKTSLILVDEKYVDLLT